MKKSLLITLVILVMVFVVPTEAGPALPWEMVLDQEFVVALNPGTSYTWPVAGEFCDGGLYGSEIASNVPIPEGWQVTFATGYSEGQCIYRYLNTIPLRSTYGWTAYSTNSYPSPRRIAGNELMLIGDNATEPLKTTIHLRLHYCAPWWILPLRTLRHKIMIPLVANDTS